MKHHLTRRSFLHAAGLAALPLASGPGWLAGGEPPTAVAAFPGLITRQREPANLEFPFPTLDRFLTPNERFYVRNHFAMPKLDAATWKLKVEGAVERPLELSYGELKKIPAKTVTATLECAGNSRVFLVPRPSGVLWELGAVGTAEWTGVPLADLLERAGVKPGAVEVVLEGADSGEVKDPPTSPGVIPFARSLPLEKARKPEVLLAYRMNGEELPPTHGFPLRAVVAGWYGMASVKWLTRLIVTERPFAGYYQSLDYATWQRFNGLPTLVPITSLGVKAEVARPALDEVVAAGSTYRVHGAAWAGESEVAKVEVTGDGGRTWAEAKLLGKAVPFAWRLWEYEWHVPTKPSRVTVMARATDQNGHVQPAQHDPDHRHYLIDHVLPIDVEVR
jgi:DMSO/TMAO reductase YedYZ molybdopterin-dependent catalytic subunit